MNITQKATGEQLILEIEGRIDTKTAPSLETVIQTALEGIRSLVIDLAETVYISSAGLRVILMAQKQMNRQGDMKVIHVSSDLMDIFEVTGFADILTIEWDRGMHGYRKRNGSGFCMPLPFCTGLIFG